MEMQADHELEMAREALADEDWALLTFHAQRLAAHAEQMERQVRFVRESERRRLATRIEGGRQYVGVLLNRLAQTQGAPAEMCDEIEERIARVEEWEASLV